MRLLVARNARPAANSASMQLVAQKARILDSLEGMVKIGSKSLR